MAKVRRDRTRPEPAVFEWLRRNGYGETVVAIETILREKVPEATRPAPTRDKR